MSLRSILQRSLKKNVFVVSAQGRLFSYDRGEQTRNGDGKEIRTKHIAAVLFGSVLVGAAIKEKFLSTQKSNKTSAIVNNEDDFIAGDKKPGLPVYRAEEVQQHDNKKSFWVTYRHGVYDVTNFVTSHPGGEQIYNAAGHSVEPFWNVYGMHKTKEVYELLETYRIGNLHDEDIVDHSDEELWVKEPYRDRRLIVKTAKPFNAEIPPKYQVEHFDTPNELFYVRQHMPVPELTEDHTLRVIVQGPKTSEQRFSLADLDRFPRHTLRAALMCAGNRRSEMNQVKPVKGISWAGGAISNAVWSGVLLRDVLIHCGVDLTLTGGKHVIFTGADMDATGVNFSTSIPLSLAADPGARVLLATHMNGAPLPPDHGRPLRVIVPGAPAVRSVKWLESITIGEDESPSHWHQKDYRAFNPSKTWDTADFSTAPPVYSLPVTSAICDPQNGDTVEVVDGCIQLRGYAYSGGGAKILRVDVTTDRGEHWLEARPAAADAAPPRQHYAWTLWTARVPVEAHQHEVEIWVKATDSNFNTQPEKFEDIWNIRGILSNAYHKIKVKLKH
ncbi:sulfite oxidase, mitochondrial isoform X2 [Amyelois transitella]|uniref:sulfite oxidase, mitochondrial isoform X2 n=1 Tax=Amyelois transitella TaxID=680683 RepID=UPI002990570F|nr:sulfite oxidase, mitochondrial isoform X2 [Amyelois transitella]